MPRSSLFVGLLAVPLLAQSPLTTIYTGGVSLAAPATVYFDLVLNAPLTFTQIDVNSTATAGVTGTIEVRWVSNTYVGNDTNAAAWTLGGSGPATAAGPNQPTVCVLTPFSLPPGNYGFAVTQIGLGPNYITGNGTVAPGSGTNQTFSVAEMTMLCGASAGGPPGTAICCQPRVFNGSLYFFVSGSGTVATRTPYGTGCYRRMASYYEFFSTSAAFDLSNSGISMVPSGSDYVVLPGITTWVAPTAAATTLALTDDSQVAVTLASPFPHAGGTTTSLMVCSNGFVSVATGNGTTFTPAVATMLNAQQTGWWNWHDYNPTLAGGGQVKYEQVGNVSYITWDGVWDFSGTTAANANTFQFQFDRTSGAVHLLFQTMSALGNARLVGYSPGGPSLDPGNVDLSVVLPNAITLSSADLNPLTLTASARPLIGTTINLVTANQIGTNVGVNFLSLGQIPAPGFDLGVIGAPGCPALIDLNQSLGNVISNLGLPGTSLSVVIPIPNQNGLIGAQVFTQSVWLAATANAFGALTSNGITLVLGNL
ncbi:MAG: hypothetical protein ABIP94_24780 [Planctomycetota bacterium]